MERWLNKVAVITGAGSGIGKACFTKFLNEGMVVVGFDIQNEQMEREIKANLPEDRKCRFHPVKCDVSVEDDIVKAFKWVEEELGGVDVLVNNAGTARHSTQLVQKNNTADLRAILDVNVMGPALCTREAFHSMKKRGVAGHVILVNSVVGQRPMKPPTGSFNMYAPSKYAITAMNEVLRNEFMMHETKIKVTSISPGIVKTEMLVKSNFPLDNAFLKPEDVADAIAYCIQTPPHVQIQELTLLGVGEKI